MRSYRGHDASFAPRAILRSQTARPLWDREQPRPNPDLELLRRRYIQELNGLYGGEQEQLNVLPEMAALAQTPALRNAFQYHFEKTQAHAERLAQIFAGLGVQPVKLEQRAPRPAGEARVGPLAGDDPAGCDAVLITAARQMEQREIARYLLALNCAQILWEHAAAYLLEQTLEEEYEADLILSTLDESGSSRSQAKAEGGASRPALARLAERA